MLDDAGIFYISLRVPELPLAAIRHRRDRSLESLSRWQAPQLRLMSHLLPASLLLRQPRVDLQCSEKSKNSHGARRPIVKGEIFFS